MKSLVSFPRYEGYKDSGVDWLGEIPRDWLIKPGFTVFSENKRSNKGMIENSVLSLSYGRIVIRPPERLVGLVPESFETYQLVEPNDIIVRCTDLQNDQTSLRIGFSENYGIITSAYLNLKVSPLFNAKYYYYYLHSLDITKVLYKLGSGLRQNLGFIDFKRLAVLDFSYAKQKLIATFLDQKTAQIDQAIDIKKKQIELLKERQQVIIQQAVTKGLDPSVKMKDSGVEWIGEVPEHWEVKALKYLKSNIKNAFVDGPFGSNLKSDHYVENGDVYVVESGFITTGTFINKKFKTITKEHFRTILRSECRGADVVIAKIGANFGMAAELPMLDKPAVVSGNSLKITLDQSKVLNGIFTKLMGVAKSSGGFEDIVNASAQPALSLGGLNNLLLPVAPLKEQIQIEKYLSIILSKFKDIHLIQQSQIKKLQEYKSSLINSAVTGKIKITPDMIAAEG